MAEASRQLDSLFEAEFQEIQDTEAEFDRQFARDMAELRKALSTPPE